MSVSRLPADVRRLIDRRIDSAAQLEVLLMLVRSAEAHTAEHIAGELRLDVAHARDQLDKLSAAGLVERQSDAYRYAPQDLKTADTVERLAQLYGTYRVAITTAVYSKPQQRLRDFSDAFRFKKEDN